MVRKSKKFLVGAAVGSGIAARSAEIGGADFLLATSAGRVRNMGASSIASVLPIGNASQMSFDFATREVLPQVDIPVFLGVNCWTDDPTDEYWIETIIEHGFAGVVNFPCAMHLSQAMQKILGNSGHGARAETEMLSKLQSRGLKAMCYCGSMDHVALAVEASLESIIFNFGWNAGGTHGHTAKLSLEEAALIARNVNRLVKGRNRKVQLFLEGGPIKSAKDLSSVVQAADIDGYVGGSTIEKFPIESSIADRIAEYRRAGVPDVVVKGGTEKVLKRAKKHGLVGRSEVNISFLEHFHRLACTDLNLELIVEEGSEVQALVAFFADIMRCNNPSKISHIEPEENTPVDTLLGQIFGAQRGNRRIRGVLEDDSLALVVIHQPAEMSPAVRKKLSGLLAKGVFKPVSSFEQIEPVPRIMIISKGSAHFTSAQIEPLGLKVASLVVPPLRTRLEDIETLMNRDLTEIGRQAARRIEIKPSGLRVFRHHDWLRNEAELHEVVLRMIESGCEEVEANTARSLLENHTRLEKKFVASSSAPKERILEILARHNFRKGDAAKALGISRKTLYNRMKKFNLN